MGLDTNVGGRDRIGRALLAVVLTVAAVIAYREGNRSRAVLVAVGALGFGFNATTCFCGVNETFGIDTSA